MPVDTTDGRVLELYVRSIAAGGAARPPLADRVTALAATGTVADAEVHVWGDEVALSTTALRTRVGRTILDRVASFRSWARERGGTMTPFFESRTVTGRLTGETDATLRLPMACLAEYEDGELVHVAPVRTDGSVCTVEDRLRALESDTGPSGGTAAPARN
jgi:hypothetical protein